jgi:Recombinase
MREKRIGRRYSERTEKWGADILPVIEDIKANGATSLREIAAVLNERGIPSARGGTWSAVQVMRVLAT